MHIPDGLVAPHVYLPSYLLAGGIALVSFRNIRSSFVEENIPYLASLSAFSFILSSIAVPLPGGTSVHGMGMAPIAILFGPWVAYICTALVLILQALILGEGGITTYPLNLLSMGLVGSFSAYWVFKLFPHRSYAPFLSGLISVLCSAFVLALLLGMHPYFFKDPSGKPLYFPYPLTITLPALLLPHILAGVSEGILTHIALNLLKNRIKKYV
ncbi:MAG: energy-coupling factor ABC transporter permease [Aquificaceae bacterium]|nr:energy-coupling factor ABC transporter permease [Aquificaceae bacterium]